MLINDKPHDECGIIGIFAPNEDVARMAYFGLYALQHRGQEAAGIAVSDGVMARVHKDVGLVRFGTQENDDERLCHRRMPAFLKFSISLGSTGYAPGLNACPVSIS